MGALQNIMKYYAVPVSYEFIERPPARTMKINDKHEWTLDQIRVFVEAAEYLRDKAYIMVAFQSGLSLGDILALNYSDIKREFETGILPLSITGYREKTNVAIRTFIGRDAVYYLKLYLQSRPDIKNSDPLFTLFGSNKRATHGTIQKQLRKYAKKLSFLYEEDLVNGYNPARPHSLRSAFRSRLTGKMDSDLIEFLMAHDIGQEKSTYMNQPLDELRQIYANYEHLLAIDKTSLDEVKNAEPVIPEEAMNRIRSLEDTVLSISQQNAELGGLLEDERTKNREAVDKFEALIMRMDVLEQAQREHFKKDQ